MSHFSFILPANELELADYEKIKEIQFSLRGFLFTSSAVLIMKRNTDKGFLYVFAFTSEVGGGLDDRSKQLLTPVIYQLMEFNCRNLLEDVFYKHAKQNLSIEEIENIYSH